MRTRFLLIPALLAALVTACGSPDQSTARFHDQYGIGGTAPPTASIAPTPTAFVTAPPVASDTLVSLKPLLYNDATNSPCYGQNQTTTIDKVPTDCADAWLNWDPQQIPGNDLITNAPIPKQAHIAAGIDPATGQTFAQDFYAEAVLRQWAEAQNQTQLIETMDTAPLVNTDLVLAYLKGPHSPRITNVPQCMLPTTLRVTTVDQTAIKFMVGEGFPVPSSTAVVVTYAPCPGITFTAQNGASTTQFGQKTPESEFFTGHFEPLEPFGTIFVVDGSAICGIPQVKGVCGV